MTDSPPPEPPLSSRRAALFFGFVSLLLVSVVAAGSYLAFDSLSPLAKAMKKSLDLSDTQFNLFFSVYSVPVILLVLWGGVLADRLGVRLASIGATVVFTVGAVLTATGSFPVMLLGRVFLGVGSEVFYVVMNKILAKWFKDKGILATAFGLNLFLCRAGSYAAYALGPWLLKSLGSWNLVLWTVAAICGFSLLCIILYAFVDRFGDNRQMTAYIEDAEEFNVGSVFRMPLAFWVITLLCMIYYSAIFPFMQIAPRFFAEHYTLSTQAASNLTGILILISMFTTWGFGLVVDIVGKRATLMIVGSLLMVPAHVAMTFTTLNPWISMIVLGLSFSLVPAVLWPAVPLMVKESQLGTAYGVIAMLQNVGLFLVPLLAGALRDWTNSYRAVMIMFSCFAIIGVVLAIWLKAIEVRQGGYLDRRGG